MIRIIILLLAALSPLHGAEMRKSNAIGQDLGPMEEGCAYHIEINGDETSLFRGDDLIFSSVTSDSGDIRTVVQTYPDGKRITRTWTGGRLTRIESGDSSSVLNYENGVLSSVTDTRDGDLSSYLYLHSPDGSLLAISGRDSTRQFYDRTLTVTDGTVSSRYIITDDDIILTEYDDDNVVSDWKVTDEDGFRILETVQDGTVTRTWHDESGRAVRRDVGDRRIDISYSDDIRIETEEKNDVCEKRYFRDDIEIRSELLSDDVTLRSYDHETEYDIETVYQDGKPYCRIYHDRASSKIRKVEYI